MRKLLFPFRAAFLLLGALLGVLGCARRGEAQTMQPGGGPGASATPAASHGVDDALLAGICAAPSACAAALVQVYRASSGAPTLFELQTGPACAIHGPYVYFDACGAQVHVAADHVTAAIAASSRARVASLTAGLARAELVRCSPRGARVVPAAPPPPVDPPAPIAALPGTLAPELALACRGEVRGGELVVRYTLANRGSAVANVLDETPASAAPGAPGVAQLTYVGWAGPDRANVGLGPFRYTVGDRAFFIPAATLLAPGRTLARTVRVPLPLAERDGSPSTPGATGLDARDATVTRLALIVWTLPPTAAGFARRPYPGRPELAVVRADDPLADGRYARCELAVPPSTLRRAWWPTFPRYR